MARAQVQMADLRCARIDFYESGGSASLVDDEVKAVQPGQHVVTTYGAGGCHHSLSIDGMHARRGAKGTGQLNDLHGDVCEHFASPARDCSVRLFSGHKRLNAYSRPQTAQSFDVLLSYVVLETPKDTLP